MSSVEAEVHDLIPGPGFPTRVIPTPLLEQVAVGNAPGLKRWTATEYHKMIEQGLILEGAPIELIDGALVYKDRRDERGSTMPYGPRHANAVYNLTRLDARLVERGCFMQTQSTILVSEDHEPEPDGAIVHGSIRDYRDRLPSASDVCVAIEIANSSLEYDRGTKLRIYASANIPTYLIVNLRHNRVEVFENPRPDTEVYESRKEFVAGQAFQFRLADGEMFLVAADELLV